MDQTRVKSVVFKRGRSIMGRILPGGDLIEGIVRLCTEHDIINGSIVSCIGTLEFATVVYVVPAEDATIGAEYVPPHRIEGPMELLSAQGSIGQTSEERLSVHLHGSMSTPEMKVVGGHFMESGNRVLATVELLIQENKGIRMVREPDTETGFALFKFYKSDKPR